MVTFSLRLKRLHPNTKIKDVKAFFAPSHVENVRFFKNGVAAVYFRHEDEYKKALLKQGVIHGKNVRITPWSDNTAQKSKDLEGPASVKPTWPVKTPEQLKEAILESGRLFVRNLSYECTEEELEKLFSSYGLLSDIHLSYDLLKQKPKGFAFVTFTFPADALNAFKKLDKTKFKGRLLHILPGEEPLLGKHSSIKSEDQLDGQSGNRLESSEFQKTKFKRLKESAGAAHNWNTLFIQPDAVATYLAAKFNLTKEQVLAPSGRGSVAVRLAHSETQLVAEMREFLQKNGVDLDAFRGLEAEALPGAGRRDRLEATATSTLHQLSGTAFLIKNLPVGTTEAEVRELLSRYTKRATQDDSEPRVTGADPRRVIVPPLGITAIVQYALPQQARFVYRTLAYEPFRDNILYLQWLPHGALKTEPASTPDEQDPAITPRKKRKQTQEEFELILEPSTDISNFYPSIEPDSRTTRERRSPHSNLDAMEATGPKIPRQRKFQNKKARLRLQEQATLTQASDVAETDVTPATANANEQALEEPPFIQLHKLRRSTEPDKPVLIVRNVSFQANRKELTELFKPVGGLIRVRLPAKPAGGHRGFAFVEFNTVDQAKLALETLGTDTHFLGRRLRIEFAQC